jgi:hypothetical protein
VNILVHLIVICAVAALVIVPIIVIFHGIGFIFNQPSRAELEAQAQSKRYQEIIDNWDKNSL